MLTGCKCSRYGVLVVKFIARETNVQVNPIRLILNSTAEVLQSHFKLQFFYRFPFFSLLVFVIRSAQLQYCKKKTHSSLLIIIKGWLTIRVWSTNSRL